MIIVQLIGGLGNQMFQYALARNLAFLHDVEFKIDISTFKNYKLRRYSLNHFNIIENFASKEDIDRFNRNKGVGKVIRKFIEKSKPYYKHFVVKEKFFFQFDPNILKLSNNVYLQGYWQNEKYFKNIQDIIREEFTVKYALEGKNKKIADQIQDTNSIALHIRRKDYISDSRTNQMHGFCGLDYYHKCVSLIAEKISNPHFFIFSDDIEWVKSNLRLRYPTTYVENNQPDKNYEDLRLMNLSQHSIIANSSFSWWAAWLNSNPNKIVIAPEKWLKNITINTQDLIPQSWIKI